MDISTGWGVERQVERLGFGDCYVVFFSDDPRPCSSMASVKPVVVVQQPRVRGTIPFAALPSPDFILPVAFR